jgi:hypothetical protein
MGFDINPYDPCVANKMVNSTQMTIRWHMDELMMSHVSRDKIMKIVQEIKISMGKISPKTLERYMTIWGSHLTSHSLKRSR